MTLFRFATAVLLATLLGWLAYQYFHAHKHHTRSQQERVLNPFMS